MLYLLECIASFLVEPLQTMADEVMSTFSGKELLKEEKNQNLYDLIVNHGM